MFFQRFLYCFLVFVSAFCASDGSFSIPSHWFDDSDFVGKFVHASACCQPQGVELFKVGSLENSVLVRIKAKEGAYLTCDVPRSQIFNNGVFGGVVCKISVTCRCDKTTYGHVFQAPMDDETNKLLIEEPKQCVGRVEFSTKDSRKPPHLCEYNAGAESFEVTRFLRQYEDHTQSFVAVGFCYESLHRVVVRWGIRTEGCAYTALMHGGSRCIMDLNFCETCFGQRAGPEVNPERL